MANLKFLREPDQEVTGALETLVERLRAVLREDPSECIWMLWAHHTPHGYSVRLQRVAALPQHQAPSLAQRRNRRSHFSYSAGGSLDFIVDDVRERLVLDCLHRPQPDDAARRRRTDRSRAARRKASGARRAPQR
jgi:hypothetical protein